MTRKERVDGVRDRAHISVLIIGAGINGIGTFRDLALQGVDCLLVDRGDFCSGASMASSHMLHGGIRYLENGEFRLVREALSERDNLLRSAPHLTHPLPTTIPIFKWFSGLFNAPLKFLGVLDQPAERGAVVIKLGLMIYDAFVRGDSPLPGHSFRSREESLAQFPALNPDILFTATYYDGAMPSPERLAVEILLDGLDEGNHAQALNYVSAVGVEGNSLRLKDELTGESFPIYPELVVNAGGPWIDLINGDIDGDTHFVGGTKGSHLVVDHPDLRDAMGEHEIFFEYFDGRIVLIFPFRDQVLLGTTDIFIDDPDQAHCTEEEIDYILGMVPHVFPNLEVTRDHIVFQFAGVRPLPPAEGAAGQISRDHAIEIVEKSDDVPWSILNLVGGKWTTYRAFAEETTDEVLRRLGKQRRRETSTLPIGGGKKYPTDGKVQQAWIEKIARKHDLERERVARLFERYGTRAEAFATYLTAGEDRTLEHDPRYSQREIEFIVERERVARLDDLILRRSPLAWMGECTRPLLQELADILARHHHWTEEQTRIEIQRTVDILATDHGVIL